jgi:cyclophilin family peptidyl-prolyl cis-trans isomerase/HEAT repeat protein
MAAFALGEIEASSALDSLVTELSPARSNGEITARIVEAVGKIVAALPKSEEGKAQSARAAILTLLERELPQQRNRDVVLLGLTAVLRSRPEGAGKIVAKFLSSPDARVRSDAANTLARLRANDGNEQLRKLVSSDPDPIVRANAARVLGATEDKAAFDALQDQALKDVDSRVRVSAIRALASLKDPRGAVRLLERGNTWSADSLTNVPGQANEALEIVTTIGRLLQGTANQQALDWMKKIRNGFHSSAPEVELALVRVSPQAYLAELGEGAAARRKAQETVLLNWNAASALAQALGEIAALPDTNKDKAQLSDRAQDILRAMLDYKNSGLTINTLVAVHSEYAVPDMLRALAAFKSTDLGSVLNPYLEDSDVVVRAAAAELLGELPPAEAHASALIKALPASITFKENDAALAVLDALGKQKTDTANQAIKAALNSSDYLVRRRAADLLKAAGQVELLTRVGTVQTPKTLEDYRRAISRIGKKVQADVSTSSGAFTIELLAEDAPLTVDNFIQLARRGYFNGVKVHRVVPNFVIQDGDPRGDGNGGPGYQIRCEINQVPYDRGAVGMALSGKDTGGSQWFVTHSPQPHLDGGYTVFGRVVRGMNVVDAIARGDTINKIIINK